MAITSQGIGKSDLDVFLRAVDDLANELKADRSDMGTSYGALLAKLDSDSGVADTDYASSFAIGGDDRPWPANPSSASLDDSAFTSIDMSQAELVTFLTAAKTLLNELKDDRSDMGTSYDVFLAKLDSDPGVSDLDYESKFKVGGSSKPWPAAPSASAVSVSALTSLGVNQPDLYDVLSDIETLANELRADKEAMVSSYEAVLAKLDSDGGVTDTDYEASFKVGGSDKPWPANPSSAALDLSA